MNFPKFDEIVNNLYRKFPESSVRDIQATAIAELRAESISLGTSLYIAKIFKHRPNVAEACKNNISSSPDAVSFDIKLAWLYR